jgi:hypothetical protein
MPYKDFRIFLRDDCYISVEFLTVNGRVVSFVVRLVWIRHDGEDFTVARYDTAHGSAHRDIVSSTGRLLNKSWLFDMSFEDALTHAIHDFSKNHENYIKNFRARA